MFGLQANVTNTFAMYSSLFDHKQTSAHLANIIDHHPRQTCFICIWLVVRGVWQAVETVESWRVWGVRGVRGGKGAKGGKRGRG